VTLTLRRLRLLAAPATLLASMALVATVSAAPTPDQNVTIDNFAFTPGDVSVPVGATVGWTNAQADVRHTVTSSDGTFDSGILSPNDTFSFTFTQAGDLSYQCEIHPSMRGIIHVLSDSTDPAGSSDQSATSVDAAAAATQPAAAATATPAATATATPSATSTSTPAQAPAAKPTATPSSSSYGY